MAAVSHTNGFYDQQEYEVRLVRSNSDRYFGRLNSDDMNLGGLEFEPLPSGDGKHMTRLYIATWKYFYIFICFILLGFPLHLYAECQITLEWLPNGAAPDGYRLYEREEGDDYSEKHYYDVGQESSCMISGLTENSTYHFVVRAYAGSDASDYSNEATYDCTTTSSNNDPSPPTQPATISPADTSQNISLEPTLTSGEFQDPDAGDVHAQTRWQIYRLDNDECIYDVISNSDLTALDVPPETLEPFTAYYWTVRYYSQNGGISEPSPTSDFTTSNEVDSTASLSGVVGGSNGSSDGLGVGCFIQTLFGLEQ